MQCIRERAHLYLSPEVASYAAMTLADLQQFIAGTFTPTDAQLWQLARRMQML
jgi:hypothetical protein